MEVRGVILDASFDARSLRAVLGIATAEIPSRPLNIVTTLAGFAHIVGLFPTPPGKRWLDVAAGKIITFIVNDDTLDIIGFSLDHR